MELEHEIKQKGFKSPFHKGVVNIFFTSGWLESKISKVLRPYDLTHQQYNVLRILRGQHPNPATVNLIMERMLDKMSNASRLVEKLRQKGYVERHECPKDRRQADVLITREGLNLLTQLEPSFEELHSDLRAAISEEEMQLLNQILDKLRG